MILEALKDKTRPLHDAVEEKMGSTNIMSDNYPLEEYKHLLYRLWIAHSSLEPVIENFPAIATNTALQPEKRLNKRKLLAADLARLSYPLEERRVAVEITSVPEAWGALYVLEGSSLGGAMIYKHLQKRNWEAQAFSFYNCYGPETGKMWSGFRKILTEQNQPEEKYVEDLVNGACKAYQVFLDIPV